MRIESKDFYPLENIHMAHRLSFNHIKQIVMSNNLADIEQLMLNQSSDFMTMDGFSQWEEDFGHYLTLAVASVQRML